MQKQNIAKTEILVRLPGFEPGFPAISTHGWEAGVIDQAIRQPSEIRCSMLALDHSRNKSPQEGRLFLSLTNLSFLLFRPPLSLICANRFFLGLNLNPEDHAYLIRMWNTWDIASIVHLATTAPMSLLTSKEFDFGRFVSSLQLRTMLGPLRLR